MKGCAFLSLHQIVAFGYLVKPQNGNQFKFNWGILHLTITDHVFLVWDCDIRNLIISFLLLPPLSLSWLFQWKYAKVTCSFWTPINHSIPPCPMQFKLSIKLHRWNVSNVSIFLIPFLPVLSTVLKGFNDHYTNFPSIQEFLSIIFVYIFGVAGKSWCQNERLEISSFFLIAKKLIANL